MAGRARSALVVAVLAVVSAAPAGCAGPDPARATVTSPSPSLSPSPSASPSASPPIAPGVAGSSPSSAPTAPPAQNLLVSTTVRTQLVDTWVRAQHISSADVAGATPGSVYYGYLRETRSYWAVADFTPSPAALRDPSVDGRPLVQFQDGPFVFTRPTAGSWRVVTDSGGTGVCPREVPQQLAEVWHLRDHASCHGTSG